MGSGNSKQTNAPSHVWTSTAPVSLSPGLINSLQSNTETDSIRAKNLEIQIQARVAEELKRLQSAESQKQAEILQKLSQGPSDDQSKNPDRESVQKEIQELRSKLEERKRLQELGSSVEEAKKSLVKCLRDNDRRPLMCDTEVEAFKEEVGKMEGAWVEKIVR